MSEHPRPECPRCGRTMKRAYTQIRDASGNYTSVPYRWVCLACTPPEVPVKRDFARQS